MNRLAWSVIIATISLSLALISLLGCDSDETTITPSCTSPYSGVVHTPEQMRLQYNCHPQEYKFQVNEDVVVLFAYPDPMIDWVGLAFINHIPSVSSVVLDLNSNIIHKKYSSVEAEKQISDVLADEGIMRTIREHLSEYMKNQPQ